MCQVESCKSLEEELTELYPLVLEFLDFKEKHALKLTKEIDHFMTTLRENQSNCHKLDSDYFDLERAFPSFVPLQMALILCLSPRKQNLF